MLYFISGTVKAGKSMFSQCLGKSLLDCDNGKLYYLATMIPQDKEDDLRIKRHIKDREDFNFVSFEEGYNIKNILKIATHKDVVLLDSITGLLSNLMFNNKDIHINSYYDVILDIMEIKNKVKDLIVVNDDIFFEQSPKSESVNSYVENLGLIQKELGKISEFVFEVIYSIPILRKGENTSTIKLSKELYNNKCEHLYYGEIE